MKLGARRESRLHFVDEKGAAILRAGGVLGTGAYGSIAPIPPPCHHRRLATPFRHPAAREPKCNLRSAFPNRLCPSLCSGLAGFGNTGGNGANQLVKLSEEVDRCFWDDFVRYFFVVDGRDLCC
jgi:hypothetical protein